MEHAEGKKCRKGFGEEDSRLWSGGRPGRTEVWRMRQDKDSDSRRRRKDRTSGNVGKYKQLPEWLMVF